MTLPRSHFSLVFIAAAILLSGWLASISLTWSHAAERHGEVTAATIRDICDRGGTLRTYQVDKNRYVQVCRIDERQYGCRIVDLLSDGTWSEVTAFVKDQFAGKTIQQIDELVARKFWSCTGVRIK